jgi:ATPase family associated with various cellular activities (AAA)
MAEPYSTDAEHLADELRRVDLLVRAQALRWKLTTAPTKPDSLWGMLHVSADELDAYLRAPFVPPGELPAELDGVLAGPWKEAEARRRVIDERTAATARPSRLARLLGGFDLSELERDILLASLLGQLDTRYQRLFGVLQDDASRAAPAVFLLREVLQPVADGPDAVVAALRGSGRLRVHGIVELAGDEQAPLAARSLRVDERIADFLAGGDSIDARLAGVAEMAAPLEGEAGRVGPWLRARRQAGELDAVVFLTGPYGAGHERTASGLSSQAGVPLLACDVGAALDSAVGWQRCLALAFREARLREAAIVWRSCEVLLRDDAEGRPWDGLVAAAERFTGLTLLASEVPWDPAGRLHTKPFLRMDLPAPGFAERRQLWERLLEQRAPATSERSSLARFLATSFQLTEGQILDALASARGLALQRDPAFSCITPDDLAEACRRQSARRLVTFSRRIEPRAELRFADIVLPPQNARQLQELRDRIANRARVKGELGLNGALPFREGLVAMFTGSSGTGKTLAAELLARDQGVDLRRVDVSLLVSKYVGETEKNLSRLFSEAESSNSIIFFDECDSVFGKRGEVKDPRDRWAGMQVNYLLERIEAYSGVVILASNMRQNIDEAFTRRLDMVLEFPLPGPEGRLQILRGMLPCDVPHPGDDELASIAERFRLSGGNLRNVVIDAAFRALAEAGDGRPEISLRHLVIGTAREYQKLGRPVAKAEFGEELYALLGDDALNGSGA